MNDLSTLFATLQMANMAMPLVNNLVTSLTPKQEPKRQPVQPQPTQQPMPQTYGQYNPYRMY